MRPIRIAAGQRQAQPRGEPGDQISAGHDERALGEVGDAGGLVDEHEAQRAERIHQARKRAVDRKLAKLRPIHYAITPEFSLGWSSAPNFAAALFPRGHLGADFTPACVANWDSPLTLSLSPWERGRCCNRRAGVPSPRGRGTG